MKLYQSVRKFESVEVADDDVISLLDAARLVGRRVQVISNMVSMGALPWYQESVSSKLASKATRFTSRAEVLAKLGDASSVASVSSVASSPKGKGKPGRKGKAR
jgi:hypothetical protein